MEFLLSSLAPSLPLDPVAVGLRLLLALVLGVVVAAVYRRTRHHGAIPASFPTTLILLCVLIAMVTQVIGDNVARAFSLVGALSIVRFRTVVRDTQDTAYVLLAVVIGMAVGAHNLWVALLGLAVVAIASAGCKWHAKGEARPVYLLTLKLERGKEPEELMQPAMEGLARRRELVSVGTSRQGTAMEFVYETQLEQEASVEDLVRVLNRQDGVLGVQLARRDFAA